MDRQNVFPLIIFFLHICCLFLTSGTFFLVVCLELITWPLAKKFAGPYWKHIIFIPFFLFVCCLPVIILAEAYNIKLPLFDLAIFFFPLVSVIILCFCGTKFPRGNRVPEGPAYLLLAIASPAWLILLFLAGITIHVEIFHRGL